MRVACKICSDYMDNEYQVVKQHLEIHILEMKCGKDRKEERMWTCKVCGRSILDSIDGIKGHYEIHKLELECKKLRKKWYKFWA